MSQNGAGAIQDPALIIPTDDSLYTSGTLGRYSNTLNSVIENPSRVAAEADVATD
jgi:hypothetical protein